MIGPMSSSLALAQRTATQARTTMDTMARQIATGQKVSSVKDDGAAWTRANSIRSSAVVDREAVAAVSRLDASNSVALPAIESFLEGLRRVDSILLRVRNGPNAATRAVLNAELLAEKENLSTISDLTKLDPAKTTRLINYSGTGNLVIRSGELLLGYDETGFSNTIEPSYMRAFSPAQFELYDLNTITTSQVNASRTELANVIATVVSLASQAGRFLAGHEHLSRTASRQEDQKLSLAASLTDVDLGAASTALRQSETRNQLALDTISRAISAYSSYAGGLLSNVQSTQRSVLA